LRLRLAKSFTIKISGLLLFAMLVVISWLRVVQIAPSCAFTMEPHLGKAEEFEKTGVQDPA
jgi:hypothetical protein